MILGGVKNTETKPRVWDEASFHREMPIDQFLDYLNSSAKAEDDARSNASSIYSHKNQHI